MAFEGNWYCWWSVKPSLAGSIPVIRPLLESSVKFNEKYRSRLPSAADLFDPVDRKRHLGPDERLFIEDGVYYAHHAFRCDGCGLRSSFDIRNAEGEFVRCCSDECRVILKNEELEAFGEDLEALFAGAKWRRPPEEMSPDSSKAERLHDSQEVEGSSPSPGTPPAAHCGKRINLHNGETVTPCGLPDGHEGDHEGWCLGSKCRWANDTPDEATLGEEPGSGWT